MEDDVLLRSAAGAVTPEDVEVEAVTNNLTELLAAVRALSAAPEGWSGTLHTDSKITLHRLTHSRAFRGIPRWLVQRTVSLRRGRRWRVELVGGHPIKSELEAGVLRRNGARCSPWNVWCDKACQRAAREFLEREKR